MKYFLTLVFLCIFLTPKAQLGFYPGSAGYKSTGIFDTVKTIIIIDNKIKKSIDRIEGYAIREWKTWYGGIDPYMMAGDQLPPNKWIETGKFLYTNRKKILSHIWNYEILKNEFEPIPKPKKEINYKKKKIIIPEDIIPTLDSLSIPLYYKRSISIDTGNTWIGSSVYKLPWIEKDSIITINEMGAKVKLNKYFDYIDTTKAIFYIDESDFKSHKTNLKSYKGYRVLILKNQDTQYEFLNDKKQAFKERIINYVIANW